MFINSESLQQPLTIDQQRLEDISKTVLQDYYEALPDFTISFVEADEIRELNRNFRQVDSVTDVLSFESDGEIDPATGTEYLGDIIICLEQAAKQAEQSGHSVENEVALLEIHGLLHLLGYDHMDDAQKDEMWHYQDLYLDKCGIKLNRRPGEDFDF